MRLKNPFSLLSLAALSTTLIAIGATAAVPDRPQGCEKPKSIKSGTKYTRCVAKPTASDDNSYYCLKAPEAVPGTSLPTTLTVPADSGNGGIGTAIDLRVKNCRDKADKLMGDYALLIDNSMSICWNADTRSGTDCSATRVEKLAKPLIDKLYAMGANRVRVGVLGYGGRQGEMLDTTGNDPKYDFNPDFFKYPCFDTDDTNSPGHESHISYSGNDRPKDPWTTQNDNKSYNSVCEIMPIKSYTAIDIHKDFMNMAAEHPRGSTDMTYFFEGMINDALLGNNEAANDNGTNTGWARNAILITDGLPNIPRRIPEKICRDSAVLMDSLKDNGGDFYKDEEGRKYCIDRQFKYASELAKNYLEGIIDFNGGVQSPALPRRFADTNLHTVLYVDSGLAFSDVDWRHPGTALLPSDFLIESSARTGNGKVKFSYIYGDDENRETKLDTLINTTLDNSFDAHAVQRVKVTLNGPSKDNVIYNAVSPNTFDGTFGIKLTGLEPGTYTATIETYYSDQVTSQSITITVDGTEDTGTTTCTKEDANKTVDGSNPDNPQDYRDGEDGILPYSKNDGNQCRVFRNDDEANGLNSADFYRKTFSDDGLSKRAKAERLRIQGGTGNCGNILAASGASAAALIFTLLPLLGTLFLRRRK